MSPPRRRSARLATPSKPARATSELSSVAEQQDELPSHQTPSARSLRSSNAQPTTPPSSTMKPEHSEMHPSKVHHSTGEPSSALRLGFTDIKSPGKRGSAVAGPDTPTKVSTVPTSNFSFDLSKSVDKAALSNNAQRILEELQEKAARIKAELIAEREAEAETDISGRRIAKPKGKSSRYSAAHIAEFKKMDSIEGHASAWRAKNFTPVVESTGLKRSPSKASLETTPSKSSLVRSPSKSKLEQPATVPGRNLKRTSSVANLDNKPLPPTPKRFDRLASPNKPKSLPVPSQTPVKRLKRREDEDISSNRPAVKEPSTVTSTQPRARPLPKPQPQSTMRRLLSPTKASMAHTASPSKPTVSKFSMSTVSTPTKISPFKSYTNGELSAVSKPDSLKRRILSPTRIQKVKSILRGGINNMSDDRSAIPQPMPTMSQTPGPRRTEKELPPAPLSTPRRKLTKRVTFTPDTKRAALALPSPSAQRISTLKFMSGSSSKQAASPSNVLTESKSGQVDYPDLSAFSHIIGSGESSSSDKATPGAGTFTFRSDHTIKFGDGSKSGFGASPGQASVRQVRQSLKPSSPMPGSFPAPPPPSNHEDKENKEPEPNKILTGVPHGLTNKKRHRPSTDEEDAEREAAERANKKRKNEHVPSRLANSTPLGSAKKARFARGSTQSPSKTPVRPVASRVPGSATASAKKTPILSRSRLDMLSRPKNRV